MRAGLGGVNTDVPPHILPPEVWSNVKNVRMTDGKAKKFEGHEETFGAAQVEPLWLLPYQSESAYYWIYPGTNKVYVAEGNTHTDITRSSGDYNATTTRGWNGGVLGTIPVLNNGVDAPQMWNPAETSTRLQALANWPADYTCRVMRVFQNFLVAYDINDATGTRYPQRVKWSHPASGLSVPNSWDETDPTRLAGENDLLETNGQIVDALPMSDVNIIYKDDLIYGMQYIGGNFVFRFYVMFEGYGLLAPECVSSLRGRQVFIGFNDILQHDGNSIQSIIDKRTRASFFGELDEDNYRQSFSAHLPERREVWFGIPEKGETTNTLALIWNYVDDTFTFRELPSLHFAQRGVVSVDAGDWDSDNESWDSDTTSWNEVTYSEREQQLVGASADVALYQFDEGSTFAGSPFRSVLERQGLGIVGQDQNGNLIADKTSFKMVKAVWPRIEQSGGAVFNVYIGQQDEPDGPITWFGPFPYDPSTDRKINCLVGGRLIAIRFESDGSGQWELHGYDLDVVKRGTY